jgi:hypothetical protein
MFHHSNLGGNKSAGILRLLNHETKINTDTLTTHSGLLQQFVTICSMTKLFLGANWTSIKVSNQWDLGDTICMSMHFVNVPQMDMAKMLLPQDVKLV